MSRVGKQPIKIPAEINVTINGKELKIKGPKGSLEIISPRGIDIKIEKDEILVSRKSDSKSVKALHGTIRALIANMVKGVIDGWNKVLELVGTGYRAEMQGNTLILTVGFSHPIKIEASEGISFSVEKSQITVSGVDKHKVGQAAAIIRAVRPPEPYKGKGIKYIDEEVRRKPGKAAKGEGIGA